MPEVWKILICQMKFSLVICRKHCAETQTAVVSNFYLFQCGRVICLIRNMTVKWLNENRAKMWGRSWNGNVSWFAGQSAGSVGTAVTGRVDARGRVWLDGEQAADRWPDCSATAQPGDVPCTQVRAEPRGMRSALEVLWEEHESWSSCKDTTWAGHSCWVSGLCLSFVPFSLCFYLSHFPLFLISIFMLTFSCL